MYDFLSCFESSKLILPLPVFILIFSVVLFTQYIVHAMRFLSYEQMLFFFNFIRMQFDFTTKAACFLTVKSSKTPLGHKINLLVEGN